MESSRRQDQSEASTDENDNNPKCVNEAGVSGLSKRSYECVFCRRGFTNAQALGGHMNIHRKDRARAKQVVEGPSGNLIPLNLSGGAEQPKHPVWESSYESAWVVDRCPTDSMLGSYIDCHDVPRPGCSGQTNHEVSYANLSLRIELSHMEDFGIRNTMEEGNNEIDLELRLGQFSR